MKKLLILVTLVVCWGCLASPVQAAPRIQGTACTGTATGGAGSATCTLNSVVSGSKIIGFANVNQNSAISVSDNCGGTYTTQDFGTAAGSYVIQFTGTGSSGNCIVTLSASAVFRLSAVTEELSTGYTLDVHSINDPGTINTTSITTSSVTAGAADYCFSGAVDKNGQATTPTVGGVFTIRDNDGFFPVLDADGTVSAGAVTATYSGFNAAATPAATMMCFTPPGGGTTPTFRSYTLNDTSNVASAAWSPALLAGDFLVGYAGTQLTGGQISGPFLSGSSGVTMSDGTVMTQCVNTGCDFTSISSMDTRVWTGTAQAGTPTIQFNTTISSSTIGGVGIELTGVNTLDQIASTGSAGVTSPATSTLTSSSITTTNANEILLCLAQEANPIAGGNHFVSVQSPWTGVAFGNQAISWITEAATGTFSCTVNLGASGTEDYTITIMSFYQSSGGGGGSTTSYRPLPGPLQTPRALQTPARLQIPLGVQVPK